MEVKRTVKLMPRKPLYGVKRTPIMSSIERIDLTTEEIRLCLVTKCMVDEYLLDGTLLRLDFSNYNKDNNAKEVAIVEPIAEPKLDIVDVPIVEPTLDPISDESIPNVDPTLELTQVDEIDPISDESIPNVEPELEPIQVDEIPVLNENLKLDKPKGNSTLNNHKKKH
ncbi:MAG: hypothetical protein M0P49_02045 [Bacilli bacterium]|nr:hypothetical protein [Bacilli bacterium]